MYRQRGASRAQREQQAKTAFYANGVTPGASYLLIDDITTTGATLRYASRALRDDGAAEVWVAVVAHQSSTVDI